MDKAQFKTAYNALTETEQAIVKLLALGYEEVRQTHLCTQLNAAQVRTQRGTQFNSANIKNYLQDLIDKNWVELGPAQTYQLLEDRRFYATVQAISEPDFPKFKKAFLPKPIDVSYGHWFHGSLVELSRELRLAYFLQDEQRFQQLLNIAQYRFRQEAADNYLSRLLMGPFDPEWLQTIPPDWQARHLQWHLAKHYTWPTANHDFRQFLQGHPHIHTADGSDLRSILNQLLLFAGDADAAAKLLDHESELWRKLGREVMQLVLRGEDDQAIALYPKVLKALRQAWGERNARLFDSTTALYLLALLRQAGPDYVKEINKYMGYPTAFGIWTGMVTAVNLALFLQQNNADVAKKYLNSLRVQEKNIFDWMAYSWGVYWLDQSLSDKELQHLEALCAAAEEAGLDWFVLEFGTILYQLHPDSAQQESWRIKSAAVQQRTGFQPLVYAISKKARWERALDIIANLGQSKKAAKKETQKRLVWLIDFKHLQIFPKEQQLTKSGEWSSGRAVAMKRLQTGDVEGMQQQDHAAIRCIRSESVYQGWSYKWETFVPFYEGVRALIGHPHLFFNESPTVGLELVSRPLQLVVEEKESGFLLKFNHEIGHEDTVVIQETPTRYAVVEISEVQRTVHSQIGNGLTVPARARKKLEQTVQQISRFIPVSSAMQHDLAEMPKQEGSTDIIVHLLPMGDGFKIEFFVKPFRTEPPYVKPGNGQQNLIAEINGEKRLAQRRLDREVNNAQAVITVCPTLQRLSSANYEWVIDQAVDCLNILMELQPLRDSGQISIEHPKGEPIRLAGKVDFGNLSLKVQKDRGWFDVDGSLEIDGREVLQFRELLEKAAATDSYFIQLSDGQFLALTEQFRRKLRELEAVMQTNGKQLQLHPFAGELLDEVSDLLGDFQEDVAWQETKQRLSRAKKIKAIVPSTFQAVLRPYQMDGFKWLMQMAEWGVGACLADDMGLGKTIQALAVLVARAEAGPAMVAAPASVTRNWLRETQKFAPTLRPQLLGEGDRAEMIDALGPYDLLLVSYGLLPNEAEKLAAKPFATIILDEAQAIKNRATKRSQAAKTLQSDFRLITTGTPIENHLGELWNLFHFLNPGLLGSLDHFNQRFATPIERYGDHEKRQQLRRLLQPFILRRRKNEVLQELPSKTEINLMVELSAAEMAFYEALRQRALQEIEAEEGPNKRFQILAQLTRLRQAACHPQLVDEKLNISSSKLELVGDTIRELLDNGHKALVFSQFVKHLKIVEAWVQSQGIAYQYLDGQTPGKKRDEAVQAFQRGEGELFLISLKAGGTGLNLTAADYVMHLDPWWNPAVEDQASDRAHRIGQQRPVTVYRFISEYTIEEKIVQLHQEKRDLADHLLAGTESSAALSVDELIALIRG